MQNAQFGADDPVIQKNIEPEIPQEINLIDSEEGSDDSINKEDIANSIPRKKGKTAKQRINEIQREKFQAYEELQRSEQEKIYLQQEVDRLKQLNEVSTNTALDSYELAALERLESAKQIKEKAIESGDVKAQIEADIALSNAVNDYKQVQGYKNQEKITREQEYYLNQQQQYERQMYAQQYQNTGPDVINRGEAERWVQDNDWFKTDSPNYNPQMTQVVNVLCDALDAQLYRTGNQNAIFSKDYFDYIDDQLSQLQRGSSTQYSNNRNMNQGHLSMRQSREPVAPVMRGGSQISNQGPRDVRISSEERDMARRLGIKPEDYIRKKLEIERSEKVFGKNQRQF
jgi:hypothetical protein